MNSTIIAACITGACTVLAVILSNEIQLRAQDRRSVRRDTDGPRLSQPSDTEESPDADR